MRTSEKLPSAAADNFKAYVHRTLSTPHRSTRLCSVKMKHDARRLKHRLSRRTRVYASEEELFAAVRRHLAKARMRRGRRARLHSAALTGPEKEFLAGIATSGAFTLEPTLGMYADA